MKSLSLNLPGYLHEQVREHAKRDGISVDEFVASVVAEKISALLAGDSLKEKASKDNKDAFLKALKKVPKSDPEDFDRL